MFGAVLTSSKNFSASEALPAATHWKVAFCPALTSTSPKREKWGALSKIKHREIQRLGDPIIHLQFPNICPGRTTSMCGTNSISPSTLVYQMSLSLVISMHTDIFILFLFQHTFFEQDMLMHSCLAAWEKYVQIKQTNNVWDF